MPCCSTGAASTISSNPRHHVYAHQPAHHRLSHAHPPLGGTTRTPYRMLKPRLPLRPAKLYCRPPYTQPSQLAILILALDSPFISFQQKKVITRRHSQSQSSNPRRIAVNSNPNVDLSILNHTTCRIF